MAKLGVHIKEGSRNGYGTVAGSKPAVVLAVNEGGALVEVTDKSNGHTYTIFRDASLYRDAPHGIDQSTPPQAIQIANTIYPQLKAIWILNPANFYTVLNEPAGNDLSVMPTYIAFERRMMELAEADNLKLCFLNLAWGTPDDGRVAGGVSNGGIETWKQLYVPHIIRGFQAGHIYGRHDYGVMESGASGRGFQEATYLRSIGQTGGIVFTELGYNAGDQFIGVTEFMSRSAQFDTLMRQHSNVIGCCVWTYGIWQGTNEANIEPASIPLAIYLTNNPTPKWKQPEEPTMTLNEKLWNASLTEYNANRVRPGAIRYPGAAGLWKPRLLNIRFVPAHNEIGVTYEGINYKVQGWINPRTQELIEVDVWTPGKNIWTITKPEGGNTEPDNFL